MSVLQSTSLRTLPFALAALGALLIPASGQAATLARDPAGAYTASDPFFSPSRRYRTTDGKPRLDVQFAYDPESGVELVAGRPRLVGCVTADGVERIDGSDLLLWTHYPGPGFGASMIEVDASSSGLQSLVVECAVLRIEERVDRVVEGVPAGVSEQLPLGGMLVTVTGNPSFCTVAVTYGDASLRQETAPGVPLYGHDWCSSELVVTDADGVRLYRMGGSGSGAMTMRQYVRPDAMGESGRLIAEEPAIAYPVRIDFAEPLRVTSVPCRFEFRDVVLPPLYRQGLRCARCDTASRPVCRSSSSASPPSRSVTSPPRRSRTSPTAWMRCS